MKKFTSQSWSMPSAQTVVATFIGIATALLFIFRAVPAHTISPNQLERLTKYNNVFVINIATPYQGEITHTDLFIEKTELVPTSKWLPKNFHTPIIVYDENGTDAVSATQMLNAIGFTNVHYLAGGINAWVGQNKKLLDLSKLEKDVLPDKGIVLPVSWNTLGKKLVDAGVIDLAAFRKIMPLTPEQDDILTTGSDTPITINAQNSQFVVDVLWALGLAQKSSVFTDGPMGREEKKEVGNFASTGGWNLAHGLATNYLNKYDFIPLNTAQHARVADIAHNVYRPCCNNSTWFPDCNHGMAALAIIELLVSQNADDASIYRYLLGFNSFWFPDSYLTVAAYFARLGVSWDKVNAKEVLSFPYSSATGAGNVYQLVGPLPFTTSFAGGCGA